MKRESPVWGWLGGLLMAILFFLIGMIWMQINRVVGIGDWRGIGKLTAAGPALFYLIGTIFLFVTYYSISPFSKFRKFFEGKVQTKIKRNSSKKRTP